MNQIIPIDENTRIKREPLNWMLQRKRVSKNKEAWRTEGYYPDLISLASDYINEAPARADNAIRSIEELVHSIKEAETRIREITINFQKNGTHQ